MNKRTDMDKARAIAKASCTALGTPRAARALRDHLSTIIHWRSRGASWDRIAMLLRDAGWRSNAGAVISADSLRAMVSRLGRREQPSLPGTAVSTTMPMSVDPSRPSVQPKRAASGPIVGMERSDIAERIRRAAALRSGKDER